MASLWRLQNHVPIKIIVSQVGVEGGGWLRMRVARDPASGEGAGGDDLDVYYERGRRPKESRMKYEAMRSKGDYRREVLLARLCAGYRGQGRGARGQGRREGRRCSCCLFF